jgi:acyl-CoA synthetase (AMP-forming)/AMP-acid ligase II
MNAILNETHCSQRNFFDHEIRRVQINVDACIDNGAYPILRQTDLLADKGTTDAAIATKPQRQLLASNVAHVNGTSGSTGNPKGVVSSVTSDKSWSAAS